MKSWKSTKIIKVIRSVHTDMLLLQCGGGRLSPSHTRTHTHEIGCINGVQTQSSYFFLLAVMGRGVAEVQLCQTEQREGEREADEVSRRMMGCEAKLCSS